MSRRLGSIDLGSSSLHLWIVDLDGPHRTTVHLGRTGLRLVRRWAREDPGLDPSKAAEALDAISRMVERCREAGCDHIQIAATAAVREAHDHPEFCERVLARTGVSVRVLSGEDEARISFLGVADKLDESGGASLVFDLGGGSTELILGDRHGIRWLSSLPLGHLRCTQAVAPMPNPPGPATTVRLRELVTETLAPVIRDLQDHPWRRLVGVSGTVWTLSRVLEGHCGRPLPAGRTAPRMSQADVTSLRVRIEDHRRPQLAYLPGMDRRRSDSFYAGVVVVETLLQSLGRDTLWTAEGGIREGLVADFERSTRR